MSAWADIEKKLPAAALAALHEAERKKGGSQRTQRNLQQPHEQLEQQQDGPASDRADPPNIIDKVNEELLQQQARYQAEALASGRCVRLEETDVSNWVLAIKKDGVIRINAVLPGSLCDAMRGIVDERLQAKLGQNSEAALHGTNAEGFGRVYSRKKRYDMYVRNEGVFADALRHLLQNSVGDFFRDLFAGESAPRERFSQSNSSLAQTHHSVVSLAARELNSSGTVDGDRLHASLFELSTMTSDPGSPRQPIHPDNCWSDRALLYTAFVALQDIEDDMGPTLFLPGTHTRESHHTFLKGKGNAQAQFLTHAKYCTSHLKKGDVQIMDSRVLHAGLDNRSTAGKRRTLFYFTIRNPTASRADFIGIPRGSMWPDLDIKLEDYSSLNS